MNPLFLIFVCLPALEVFLMIKVGGQIGALNTVGLIFFTAVVGVYFAKQQGIQTLKSGIANLYQNKMPIFEIISGASIAIAALFLIVPGFFTDFIGFLLLVPYTRNVLIALTINKQSKRKDYTQNQTVEREIVNDKKDES